MNFPTDIKDYAKVYKNVFSKEFCESSIEKLKDVSWSTHQFYNNKGEYIYVGDDFLQSRERFSEQDAIDKEIWNLIYRYTINDFSSYHEQFKWFGGWNGYTSVKFHKYDEGTVMKLHCDHIHDIFDGETKGVPILTIVGLLNSDFEGGDFLLWDNHKVDLEQGSVLIFPSNFMFPHEVARITKGSRYSFVSWVF